MEHLVSEILGGASGFGAYGLVLLVLLLCGLGVPLPEDVALITGGWLVFRGDARLEVMVAVAFVGILGGDSIAFVLGRYLGERLERVWPFRLFITTSKRRRVEGLFAKYGQKIVVAARFMPGVRAVTYFLAGGAGMKYPTFIIFDGLAALISAPVFVMLGWHFGARIDWLIRAIRHGQRTALIIIALAVLTWVLVNRIRKRQAAREDESHPVLPPHPHPLEPKQSVGVPPKGRQAEG